VSTWELLHHGFMQRALAGALLASLACGVIGSLIVVNRMLFVSGALSHATYGGIGLALFLGWPVMPVLYGFTSVMAVGLWRLRRRYGEGEAWLGAMWSAGMALGAILVQLTPGYAPDLGGYLFGNLMTISPADLWLSGSILLVGLLIIAGGYRMWALFSADPQFAQSRGLPVAALEGVLLVLAAWAIVVVLQVAGLLLAMALFSIPALLVHHRARSLGAMMILTALLNAVCSLGGLWLAVWLDVSPGPAIVVVACFLLLIDLLWRRCQPRRSKTSNVS
jgi:zinc transport system permease protein